MKKSIINTFNKFDIPYEQLLKVTKKVIVTNRFTGEECTTSLLVASCIYWVYNTNNAYEAGDMSIPTKIFDDIRYFVLQEDKNAYMVCLD